MQWKPSRLYWLSVRQQAPLFRPHSALSAAGPKDRLLPFPAAHGRYEAWISALIPCNGKATCQPHLPFLQRRLYLKVELVRERFPDVSIPLLILNTIC